MKALLAAIFSISLLSSALAQEPAAPEHADWDFIYLAFFPDVPSSANEVEVYGVKVGAPVSFGEDSYVAGTELSIFANLTGRVDGFQAAPLFNDARQIAGMQASVVNIAKEVNGVQLGLVNCSEKSGFQIGLVNYIKDSCVPFLPIINCKF